MEKIIRAVVHAIPIKPIYTHLPSFTNSITTVRLYSHQHPYPTVIPPPQDLDDYYHSKAFKFWNNFYKRHQNKFFKDRHYLEKDWGQYFCDDDFSPNAKVVLEAGCGAGNTIFPLLATYPKLYIHACDFSPKAIELVKSHVDFREDRLNAFVCNMIKDDLLEKIDPFPVDIATLFLRRKWH